MLDLLKKISGDDVKWLVSVKESSAVVQFHTENPKAGAGPIRTARAGLSALATGAQRLPETWPRSATEPARRLAQSSRKIANGRGGRSPEVIRDAGKKPMRAVLVADAAEHLERKESRLFFKDQGSIEGYLEAISIHGSDSVSLYDALHNRKIPCQVKGGSHLLEMCSKLMLARRKVAAEGVITYNRSGDPTSIELHRVRPLDTKPTPSLEEMRGLLAH